MNCPKCKGKLKVVDVVHRPDNITLRKKKCTACTADVNTLEFIAIDSESFQEVWNENHRLTKLKEK